MWIKEGKRVNVQMWTWSVEAENCKCVNNHIIPTLLIHHKHVTDIMYEPTVSYILLLGGGTKHVLGEMWKCFIARGAKTFSLEGQN